MEASASKLTANYREYSLHVLTENRHFFLQSLLLRFAERLRYLYAAIPMIFLKIYLLVLTYNNLCKINILIDIKNRHINRIIN
jgi:hypothetical protein